MESAAQMFLTTQDTYYADLLEQLAFNALPAPFFNGSMWALNKFQQMNKLDAMDIDHGKCESGNTYSYSLTHECCASNHAQGWPKYLSSSCSHKLSTVRSRRSIRHAVICRISANHSIGPQTENRLKKIIRIWRALHEYVNVVHDPEKQCRSLSTAYRPHVWLVWYLL